MLLLVASAEATLASFDALPGSSNLGRLVGPRYCQKMTETVAACRPWAADNDCFSGLDPVGYRRMLELLPVQGCRFVTVPDVVADHRATVRLWDEWAQTVKVKGLPAAFVLQDGCHTFAQVPAGADAVFVGGTTEYKLSLETQQIVREAKSRGLWVHMGRVSTQRRIQYAQAIGCDSFDSSKFSMWSKLEIPWALKMLGSGAHPQAFAMEGSL